MRIVPEGTGSEQSVDTDLMFIHLELFLHPQMMPHSFLMNRFSEQDRTFIFCLFSSISSFSHSSFSHSSSSSLFLKISSRTKVTRHGREKKLPDRKLWQWLQSGWNHRREREKKSYTETSSLKTDSIGKCRWMLLDDGWKKMNTTERRERTMRENSFRFCFDCESVHRDESKLMIHIH